MQADITNTHNITDVYYQAGRIAHIVLDIKPVVANSYKLKEDKPVLKQEEKKAVYHDHIHSHMKPKLRESDGANMIQTFDGFLNFTIGILNGSILLLDNTTLDSCRNAIFTEWFTGY